MKRKSITSEFKSNVAIAVLKEHQTVTEIAAEFGVHPTQVNSWKKQILDSSSDIFRNKQQKQSENFDSKRDHLYSQIGRLKVEVDWLKKRRDISIESG